MAILYKHLHKLKTTLKCVKHLLERPKNIFWIYGCILFYSDHRHVSATNVAILRVVSARIQIYLQRVRITPQLKLQSLVNVL